MSYDEGTSWNVSKIIDPGIRGEEEEGGGREEGGRGEGGRENEGEREGEKGEEIDD